MSDLSIIADIGGTHTRFARALDGAPVDIVSQRTKEITSLEAALEAYQQEVAPSATITSLAIAAAGPVSGNKGQREVRMVNAPWGIEEARLGATFDVDDIVLMNDFAAQALSLPHLGPEDLTQIGDRSDGEEGGVRAVIGPGTGLGVAGLVKGGHGRFSPLVGEGGHVDLAATNEEEIALLTLLAVRFGHVSAERVLSGPGIEALYAALLSLAGKEGPALSAANVSEAARGDDEIAKHTLHIFSGWLGAVAGNLALTIGAVGGVYIAGGVVLALGELFDTTAFRGRFEAKGRFSFYTEAIPTWLITHPHPALVGLARA